MLTEINLGLESGWSGRWQGSTLGSKAEGSTVGRAQPWVLRADGLTVGGSQSGFREQVIGPVPGATFELGEQKPRLLAGANTGL